MNHDKETESTPKPVLVIAGPTASGKTATALLLCQALDGEIVSADSMQIYRGMDIGTAKATKQEQNLIRHHLLDIREPGEPYSVAQYKKDATIAIYDIFSRGKQPVLCGGTGQYLSAVIEGISFFPHPPNHSLRARLMERSERLGIEQMLSELAVVDPESAAKLAPGDRKRIIRALEIYYQTGMTIGQQNQLSRQKGPDFDFRIFGLSHDRAILYERINQRVGQMIDAGLIDEVRQLLARGLDPASTCLQAIGYKEVLPYLAGDKSLESVADDIRQASRRYAKRQMTWLKKITNIYWLKNHSPEENTKNILKNI
ncbi:MAG: tRNA (adenosine(37)-N6)-dimethylallyltransferase MiaA [Saccharofermentanales bacterium]|jgi:tRNA dimethylallyltransferase|nr:tRNA (adenosine(37)-N6)-dimethylallyltransferase MiaA [Clostridiaceae bacterium]